jgi:hypothetical protein
MTSITLDELQRQKLELAAERESLALAKEMLQLQSECEQLEAEVAALQDGQTSLRNEDVESPETTVATFVQGGTNAETPAKKWRFPSWLKI